MPTMPKLDAPLFRTEEDDREDELLDEAFQLFSEWCWSMGLQDSDPEFDREYWEAQAALERAEEAEATASESTVPMVRAA